MKWNLAHTLEGMGFCAGDHIMEYCGTVILLDSKGVLTMVYNTQKYWVFGLCPSSGILETIKHNVSETVSVSVLR
jgi:hypothetical protein